MPLLAFRTPPPDELELLATTQSTSVSVPEALFPTALLDALLSVRPDIVTNAGLAASVRSDAPLMVSCVAPGP